MAVSLINQLKKIFINKNSFISWGAIIIVLNLFLWFNAPIIYGADYPQAQSLIQTYLIAVAIVFAMANFTPKVMKEPVSSGTQNFIIFFLVFFLASSVIPKQVAGGFGSLPFAITTAKAGISLVMLEITTRGISEELIFRGFLSNVLGKYGPILATILFSVFHLYIYGLSLIALVFTFLAGAMLQIIYNKKGLTASAGAHAGLNVGLWGLI